MSDKERLIEFVRGLSEKEAEKIINVLLQKESSASPEGCKKPSPTGSPSQNP